MQIFSGSSNRELASKIAKLLESQMGKVESSKFENGERRVRVMGEAKGSVALIQSLSSPVDEHLIEFCLLGDALTRQGHTNMVGIVPWLGYSKQDKVFLPGEPLSAKVIAQILQTTKIKKIITFDLHNRAITGFFDIPVVELSAKPLFLEYFRKMVGADTVVVAPDEGAVKASAYFARELNIPIAYMDKRRDLKTGKVEVVSMSGEVKGKRVIIVDDMIVTGSTMMESAKYLKKQGAKSVSVAATHHLHIPGVQEKLEKSEIDEVVVTDSVSKIINNQVPIINKKLKILSIAQMIVDELQ
ncbi:MAG: ribose-phosphate pyrophosphokinase [Microgenomates group bacterium]